jgi:hypothetical protein
MADDAGQAELRQHNVVQIFNALTVKSPSAPPTEVWTTAAQIESSLLSTSSSQQMYVESVRQVVASTNLPTESALQQQFEQQLQRQNAEQQAMLQVNQALLQTNGGNQVQAYSPTASVGDSSPSRKRKRNRGAAKQPLTSLSAYNRFALVMRARLETENPGIKPNEVSKSLGKMWKTVGAQVRQVYHASADQDKALLAQGFNSPSTAAQQLGVSTSIESKKKTPMISANKKAFMLAHGVKRRLTARSEGSPQAGGSSALAHKPPMTDFERFQKVVGTRLVEQNPGMVSEKRAFIRSCARMLQPTLFIIY